jgi:hypothetical protein
MLSFRLTETLFELVPVFRIHTLDYGSGSLDPYTGLRIRIIDPYTKLRIRNTIEYCTCSSLSLSSSSFHFWKSTWKKMTMFTYSIVQRSWYISRCFLSGAYQCHIYNSINGFVCFRNIILEQTIKGFVKFYQNVNKNLIFHRTKI